MTVTIRNAVGADLDALIRLNVQLQRLHAQVYPADFKSSTDEGEVRDFSTSVMRRTDHTILLAQVDGAVVGYAWIEIQPAIGCRLGPYNPGGGASACQRYWRNRPRHVVAK
jgi:hypothetical protein